MEKLPQECRDHFATYLEREDLNNIVLVSRDYPDYFTASNWYHVWLTGLPVEFTTNLKRFLAAKPDEKHSFIRQATVIPQWAANDHKVFRQQKDPVPGFSNPVFNTHSHLIIQAISKMTCLQRLALVLNVLNDEQQGNFCTMLDTTPKWDTLKALTICAPEGIVPTVLNQCNVKVLVEEFVFSLHVRDILPEFVQEALRFPINDEDPKWDRDEHMWQPVQENASQYDEWYIDLARRVYEASPCIQRLTIIDDEYGVYDARYTFIRSHGDFFHTEYETGPVAWEMRYWVVQ
ncbi:hypothetical protein ACHAPU_009301 [Fusarium lateritium]